MRKLFAALGLLGLCAIPTGHAVAATCDIEVDARSLYSVTVDGQPFKDKRYLTYDDALGLRDVLVSSGVCKRAQPSRKCSVRKEGAGIYKLTRGGTEFDRHAVYSSYETAFAEARKLADRQVCYVE
ncbi:MAG: hypothetical protein R3286_09340 [Gammaproteobacteria bacterium]|nr:hypothetical protein [Gammaproteobacteria bacterium]